MAGLVEVFALFGILGLGQLVMIYQYLHKIANEGPVIPKICYFALDASWPDNGTLHPALNATLCTHINFIGTDVTSQGEIAVPDTATVSKYFDKIPLLKKQNPALKVLVTNGGGGPAGFTLMLATRENRTRFVNSIVPYLQKYGFDGFDLDFEFPGINDHPRGQRGNFTLLVQELRQVFDETAAHGGKKYLLSAAVGAGRVVMEAYQIPELARSLDYINLMTYDLHSYAAYDPITGYNSPLYPGTWRHQIVLTAGNVGWSTHEWNQRGMPKSKIIVGIPTYTHAWTLEFPATFHGLNAPATGPGALDGTGYPNVCAFLQKNGTVVVWDDDAAVPYAYNGDQWLSYDNETSVAMKAKWTIDNGFGGVMIYSLNADDFLGTCGHGKFPLAVAINKAIKKTRFFL